MITMYRFGTPIIDTEAVVVRQPVAAAYQPGDTPCLPGWRPLSSTRTLSQTAPRAGARPCRSPGRTPGSSQSS